MTGYGKWIMDAPPGMTETWAWTSGGWPRTPEGMREAAAEFSAWADAHDTVTLVVPKATAAAHARGNYSVNDVQAVQIAARKALGMEP